MVSWARTVTRHQHHVEIQTSQSEASYIIRGHTYICSPRTAKLQSAGEVHLAKQQMFPMSPRSFLKLRGDIPKSYQESAFGCLMADQVTADFVGLSQERANKEIE